MVDGTGMCGGCRVSVGGEQKFVCVDGPEFDGHQVDFDELSARLRAYREQEAGVAAPVRSGLSLPQPVQLTLGRLTEPSRRPMAKKITQKTKTPDAPPGSPRAGAQLRRSRARLPRGHGGARGQALHPVQEQARASPAARSRSTSRTFIQQVAERDFEGAYRTLMERNVLPAICGRVCPQEEQCEAKCTLGVKNRAGRHRPPRALRRRLRRRS